MSQNCTKKPRNVYYVGLNLITNKVLSCHNEQKSTKTCSFG